MKINSIDRYQDISCEHRAISTCEQALKKSEKKRHFNVTQLNINS